MTFTDTLYFHSELHTAERVGARIAAGAPAPRFDRPFDLALVETDDRRSLLKRQLIEVDSKIRSLNRQREEIEKRLAEVEEHERAQIAALKRFHETGEIDPILVPDCEQEAHKELAREEGEAAKRAEEERKAAVAEVAPPKGWEVAATRTDEEFIYVTWKRRRAAPVARNPERLDVIRRVMKQRAEAATQAWVACPDHTTLAPFLGRSLRQMDSLKGPRGP